MTETRIDWRNDDGLTLAELMVYVVTAVIVLGVVSALFFTSTTLASRADSDIAATNKGQLTAESIASGIRNSSGFKLTTDATSGDQLLVARVARGTNRTVSYDCEAWYYSVSAKTIRFHKQASGATSTANLSTWTAVASNISPYPNVTTVLNGGWPNITAAFIANSPKGTATKISSTTISRAATEVKDTCY